MQVSSRARIEQRAAWGLSAGLADDASAIPPNIEVMTWFGFLLRELARPYAERNMDGPWQRKSAKVLL